MAQGDFLPWEMTSKSFFLSDFSGAYGKCNEWLKREFMLREKILFGLQV